nr:flagellar basal body P-ring formation chaperone FlgA [uncultured Cohaesibacter sp.]
MKHSFNIRAESLRLILQAARAQWLMLKLALACLLLAQTATAATLDADTAILRQNVTVDSRLVTLGDLFKNVGNFANKAVFRSPSLGQSGTIQADRVVEAALRAGLRKVSTNNISVVKVSRLSELVTEADIFKGLEDQMKSKGYVSSDAKLDIELNGHLADQHAAPDGISPFEIRDLKFDRMSGRFVANLFIYGRDDLGAIHLNGHAMETVMVPVMTRAVQRGEVVTENDVILTRMPLQKARLANPAEINEVVGMAVKQTMRAGMIANSAYFTAPDMVKRSDTVTITFDAGNLSLSIMGKALANGTKGDIIPVQNAQTNRIVRAEIIDHGLLKISKPLQTVASLGAN